VDWITLAGRILELVLRLVDANQKGQLDQQKLDLIVLALKEPPPPKEPTP
jgi:hypothetical protein